MCLLRQGVVRLARVKLDVVVVEGRHAGLHELIHLLLVAVEWHLHWKRLHETAARFRNLAQSAQIDSIRKRSLKRQNHTKYRLTGYIVTTE